MGSPRCGLLDLTYRSQKSLKQSVPFSESSGDTERLATANGPLLERFINLQLAVRLEKHGNTCKPIRPGVTTDEHNELTPLRRELRLL